MAVDHSKIVVVIFLADKSARVLAESADLVFKWLRITDQLGFIQDIIHVFHDFIADFHPYADIDGSRLVGDAVFRAEFFQPVRAPSARGDYRGSGKDFHRLRRIDGFLQQDAPAGFPVQHHVDAVPPKQDLYPAGQQIFLDGQVDLLGFFGAQMADRAVHQL